MKLSVSTINMKKTLKLLKSVHTSSTAVSHSEALRRKLLNWRLCSVQPCVDGILARNILSAATVSAEYENSFEFFDVFRVLLKRISFQLNIFIIKIPTSVSKRYSTRFLTNCMNRDRTVTSFYR